MKSGKKKKISKAKLRAIIVTCVSLVLGLALVILNAFIPVKYLSAYLVSGGKGAQDGVMRVRYVDVGYGDCTVVELPDGKNMLIDAGNGSTAYTKCILKFLNKCDIDRIDYLVCTSVNSEHCGGLAEIIKYKEVGRIYMPYCTNVYITDEFYDFCAAASSCGAEIIYSEYGTGVAEDDYFFVFLSPTAHTSEYSEYYTMNSEPSYASCNNASAVLWLEYSASAFLFTSDAGTDVLEKIVYEYALCSGVGDRYCPVGNYTVNLSDCDVVQVACHGSEDSACAAFYDTLSPHTAIISLGDDGASTQVLSDVINYVGDELYMTSYYGTVTIEATLSGYSVV